MATMVEGLPVAQETEVTAKAARRRFTAAEKLRVLREADHCTKPGELGALLRREGLYSSHISAWRAARQRGELAGLTPHPRGPKAKPVDPRDRKLAEQAREIARLQARLERAEGLIALQKKGSSGDSGGEV
jgi:transposase-like protein